MRSALRPHGRGLHYYQEFVVASIFGSDSVDVAHGKSQFRIGIVGTGTSDADFLLGCHTRWISEWSPITTSRKVGTYKMLQLLLLFLAGNVVVGLTTYIFFLLLRRDPNLVARREAIFEMNHRAVRVEAGEAELAASRTELTTLERRTQEVQGAIADRVPLDDPPMTKIAYTLLGAILGELEGGVVFLLSGPVAFLSLSAQAWAFIAPLFAAGWIVLLHVLIGSMVADKHRPARTIRRAKIGAVSCGLAVIAGAWLTLSGRNITDAHLVEQLAGIGIMILAVLLSLCAAFCTIVATTLLEAQRYERELVRLERLRNMFGRHIQLVEKDLARLQVLDTPEGQPASTQKADTASPVGIVPGALMILLLVALPSLSRAQPMASPHSIISVSKTEVPPQDAPLRGSVPAFVRLGACEVLIDRTASVDRLPFQNTITQTSAMLPRIVDAFQCSLVRLTPFAGDLFISIEEIPVPSAEDVAAICRATRPVATSARNAALEVLYPKTVASAHQQAAVDACMVERQAVDEQKRQQRRAAINQASDHLRLLGALDPRGPCTALPQVIKRALTRSQHVVVVSDGVPSCTPPATTVAVPGDGHLIFLLVPSGNLGGVARANLLTNRLNDLERLFPGARALLAPEATLSFWVQLGNAK